MTIPTSSNNNGIKNSDLKNLYELYSDNPNTITPSNPARNSMGELNKSFKSAPTSTSANHQVSAQTPTKSVTAKVNGIWNRLTQAISPKKDKVNSISQESFKRLESSRTSTPPKTDKKQFGDLTKGFYLAATGVAKLYQSAQQKFSELVDIFNGIGSTSHIPPPVKSPDKSDATPTNEPIKEEIVVEEVYDDSHIQMAANARREIIKETFEKIYSDVKQFAPQLESTKNKASDKDRAAILKAENELTDAVKDAQSKQTEENLKVIRTKLDELKELVNNVSAKPRG